MDSRTGARLDAHLDRKLMQHLSRETQQQAEQDYLEDLERELFETGIDIAGENYGKGDMDAAWCDSLAYSEWMAEFGTADLKRRVELNAEYEQRKADWLRDQYIPHLAEELKQHDINCMFDEGMA